MAATSESRQRQQDQQRDSRPEIAAGDAALRHRVKVEQAGRTEHVEKERPFVGGCGVVVAVVDDRQGQRRSVTRSTRCPQQRVVARVPWRQQQPEAELLDGLARPPTRSRVERARGRPATSPRSRWQPAPSAATGGRRRGRAARPPPSEINRLVSDERRGAEPSRDAEHATRREPAEQRCATPLACRARFPTA